MCEPVGVAEIAQRLGVKPATVTAWRSRGIFPPPDWTLSRCDLWKLDTALEWARKTNRLHEGEATQPVRCPHGREFTDACGECGRLH